ncbi:hypothetical protein COBT_001956 [Conglomerata obtusa]
MQNLLSECLDPLKHAQLEPHLIALVSTHEGAEELKGLLLKDHSLSFIFLKSVVKKLVLQNNFYLIRSIIKDEIFLQRVLSASRVNFNMLLAFFEILSVNDVLDGDFYLFVSKVNNSYNVDNIILNNAKNDVLELWLSVLVSCFRKYEICVRSNNLYTEITQNVSLFGPLILHLLSSNLYLESSLKIFYSFVFQDVPSFFESHSEDVNTFLCSIYASHHELRDLVLQILELYVLKYSEMIDFPRLLGVLVSSLEQKRMCDISIKEVLLLVNIVKRKLVNVIRPLILRIVKILHKMCYQFEHYEERNNTNERKVIDIYNKENSRSNNSIQNSLYPKSQFYVQSPCALEYTRNTKKLESDPYRGELTEALLIIDALFNLDYKNIICFTNTEADIFFCTVLREKLSDVVLDIIKNDILCKTQNIINNNMNNNINDTINLHNNLHRKDSIHPSNNVHTNTNENKFYNHSECKNNVLNEFQVFAIIRFLRCKEIIIENQNEFNLFITENLLKCNFSYFIILDYLNHIFRKKRNVFNNIIYDELITKIILHKLNESDDEFTSEFILNVIRIKVLGDSKCYINTRDNLIQCNTSIYNINNNAFYNTNLSETLFNYIYLKSCDYQKMTNFDSSFHIFNSLAYFIKANKNHDKIFILIEKIYRTEAEELFSLSIQLMALLVINNSFNNLALEVFTNESLWNISELRLPLSMLGLALYKKNRTGRAVLENLTLFIAPSDSFCAYLLTEHLKYENEDDHFAFLMAVAQKNTSYEGILICLARMHSNDKIELVAIKCVEELCKTVVNKKSLRRVLKSLRFLDIEKEKLLERNFNRKGEIGFLFDAIVDDFEL